MYIKIIGNNFGNFPYKLGINRLADYGETFNHRRECGPGGLFYCKLRYLPMWFGYGDTLCLVKPNDYANVVAVENKYKTDVLEIMEMMPLGEISTWEFILKQKNGLTPNGIAACLTWAIRDLRYNLADFISKCDKLAGADLRGAMAEAADWGHLEIFKRLIDKGGRVADHEDYVETCVSEGRVDAIKFFVEKGFVFEEPFKMEYLTFAARSGSVPMVDFFLNRGLNLREEGAHMLSFAAEKGDLPMVKHLVAKGADINFKNKYVDSPIDSAAYEGYDSIIMFLLENGAKVGDTALSCAAIAGHLTTTKLLVDAGVSSQLQEALHCALDEEHHDVAAYLQSQIVLADVTINGE